MIKPEGKLTVITDYREGLSKVVDGVSMETAIKQAERIAELEVKLCETKQALKIAQSERTGLEETEKQLNQLEADKKELLEWVSYVKEWINDIEEQDMRSLSLTIAQSQDEALTGIFKEAGQLLEQMEDKQN